jgi:hypothetical protein
MTLMPSLHVLFVSGYYQLTMLYNFSFTSPGLIVTVRLPSIAEIDIKIQSSSAIHKNSFLGIDPRQLGDTCCLSELVLGNEFIQFEETTGN